MRPPYHYGEYKWDKYLLDIQQGASQASKAAQQAAVHQLNELRAQTDKLDQLHTTLEEMRAEFIWGINVIVDRLDVQIQHLSKIAEMLDGIHRTLQSPLLTQARELFLLGQDHYRKGLWDEALKAYLKAEQMNEVDFPLQIQIGKTYLYGSDGTGSSTDVSKAETHLLLAARYASAEKEALPHWEKHCGEAYYHAAVAAYIAGEQEHALGHTDAVQTCLHRALQHLENSATLWPRFTDAVYTQAKCHALLGQTTDALMKLEALSDRDRRYFAKASADGDFTLIQGEVEDVFRRATVSPGPRALGAEKNLNDVSELLKWAICSKPTSQEGLARIQSVEHQLPADWQSIKTLDVDIEGMQERLGRTKEDLDATALRGFQENVEASKEAARLCNARKNASESSVKDLKKTMRRTSGKAMGCLFSLIFFFGGIFLAALFGGAAIEQLPRKYFFPVVTLPVCLFALLGAILGSALWRRKKNRPHVEAIEEHLRKATEFDRTLPMLEEQAVKWQKEMANFTAWRAQHNVSSHPPQVGADVAS